MKSAFDDQEQYELTELGKQFVHYTMNELVTQLGGSPTTDSTSTGEDIGTRQTLNT